MSAERQDPLGEDEAGALRRALVRFLVESSFEGAPEAKSADEVLAGLRGVLGPATEHLSRIEQRTEKLEAAVARLGEQVAHAAQSGNAMEAVSKLRTDLQGLIKEVTKREESAEKLRTLAIDTLQDVLRAVATVEEASRALAREPQPQPQNTEPRPRVTVVPPPAAAPVRRGTGLGGVLVGVITGVAASVLTAVLLLNVYPGLEGQRFSPAPGADAELSALAVQPRRDPTAHSTPPQAHAPAPVSSSSSSSTAAPVQQSQAALSAWQQLWQRALQVEVSSCPGGAAGPLQRCVCPGKPAVEDCTLSAAQLSRGRSVLALQAVLKGHEPSLLEGKVDGALGRGTFGALARLARGCGPEVSGAVRSLKQAWQAGKDRPMESPVSRLLGVLASAPPRCLQKDSP